MKTDKWETYFLSHHHSEEGYVEMERLLFPWELQGLVASQPPLSASFGLCFLSTSGLEAAAPALAISQPGRKGKEGVEQVLKFPWPKIEMSFLVNLSTHQERDQEI